jgi:hypothetical protein
VAEREVEALLARPDFRRLLDAVRALAVLPEEERLARLEQMAWCTLELAMAEGDWRCAAFVLTERRLGRNPARTLAQRVVKAQARAATAAPPAAPKPAEPAPPPRAPALRPGRCRRAPGRRLLARRGRHRGRPGARAGGTSPAAGRSTRPFPCPAAPPGQRPRRPPARRHGRPAPRARSRVPARPAPRLGPRAISLPDDPYLTARSKTPFSPRSRHRRRARWSTCTRPP